MQYDRRTMYCICTRTILGNGMSDLITKHRQIELLNGEDCSPGRHQGMGDHDGVIVLSETSFLFVIARAYVSQCEQSQRSCTGCT